MNGTKELLNSMPKGSRIFLDSMVFIYTIEKNPDYYELSYSILSKIEENRYFGFTSVMSLIETLSKRNLDANLLKRDYIASYFANVTNLTVSDINHEIAYNSAQLRRNYNILIPDAIQMATALVHKCDLFITNDEVFRKVQPIMTLILDDLL